MESTIQVAVLESDKLIAELLADFLCKHEFQLSFVVHGIKECTNTLEEGNNLPDILIMDLKLTDGNGLKMVSLLQKNYPSMKLIALSGYYQPMHSGHLFQVGFSAFLPKETSKNQLLTAIRHVAEHGHYFYEAQLSILRKQISKRTPVLSVYPKDMLSEREMEVLIFVCQLFSNKEIADRLFLSEKTIEVHKSNLFAKTNTRNVAGLILYAIQNQLIDANEIFT